jgi:ribonuclease BN (tRNA processing enzyme)
MAHVSLLGTGSGKLNPERNASAYLIETGHGDVLLDAGEPVSATLARRAYDWSALHALIITHTHADHTGGVPMLVQQLHLSGRRRPFTIYGPPEYVHRLSELLSIHYLFIEALRFDLAVRELTVKRPFEICGVRFIASSTRHLVPAASRAAELGYANACQAFAIRAELDGRALFYSGDVNAFEDIRQAMAGCDLALVDSTHVDLAAVLSWAASHPGTRIILSHVAEGFDMQALQVELTKTGTDSVRVAGEGEVLLI